MKPLIHSLITLSVLLAHPVLATLVTEDFSEYNTAKLEGQAGGAGLSGNWLGNTNNTVVSGDLSGPAASASLIHPQTGTAQSFQNPATGNGFSDDQTRIALSTPFSGVTWISFVAQITAGNTYRAGLGLNAVGVGQDSNDMNIFLSGSGPVVQVRKSSSIIFSKTLSTPYPTNFFIVARMDPTATTDNVDLWINPTSSSAFFSAPDIADADVPFTGSVITNFSVGGYNTESSIDNIRLGTSLSDVAAVPEPATLALLITGLLSILGIRRSLQRRSC